MEVMQKNRKNAAFTLIELLVVVSIIALLVSILLPALGRAREQATRVKCSAGFHQIGLGLQTYAAAYDELPPMYWTETLTYKENPRMVPPSPWWAYFVGNVSVNPPHNFTSGPYGLGCLFSTGVIDEAECFYCPGFKEVSDTNAFRFYYDNFMKPGLPWPTPAEPGSGTIRINSTYWPQSGKKRFVPTNGGFPAGVSYPSITYKPSEFTAQYTVCTELIYSYWIMPHKWNGEIEGMNALFGDGHVKWCQDEEALDETLWPRDEDCRWANTKNPGDHSLKWITIISSLQP